MEDAITESMVGSRVFRDAEGLIKFIDVIANVTGDPLTRNSWAGTGGGARQYEKERCKKTAVKKVLPSNSLMRRSRW